MAISETKEKDAQLVPAGNASIVMATTAQEQVALIFSETPTQFIKQREGRGGKTFDYVETNYIIARLNATFLCDWDLDIIEEKIFKEIGQIATKVKLIARLLDGRVISKTAWGGSEIKSSSKGIIDIADDLKAAESDALKKAASMIGICWDVYSGITNGSDTKKAEKDYSKDEFTDEEIASQQDISDLATNPDEDAEERKNLAGWIKMYLESKTIDYKTFKEFLDEIDWKPVRKFVGKQFGNLSLSDGKLEDLRYLKTNIDKCIDKFIKKQVGK